MSIIAATAAATFLFSISRIPPGKSKASRTHGMISHNCRNFGLLIMTGSWDSWLKQTKFESFSVQIYLLSLPYHDIRMPFSCMGLLEYEALKHFQCSHRLIAMIASPSTEQTLTAKIPSRPPTLSLRGGAWCRSKTTSANFRPTSA